YAQSQFDKAEPLLAWIYASPELQQKMAPRNRAWLLAQYGVCRSKHVASSGAGQGIDAEKVLHEAWDSLTAAGLAGDKHASDVAAALAERCESTGRTEEAASWRTRITTPP